MHGFKGSVKAYAPPIRGPVNPCPGDAGYSRKKVMAMEVSKENMMDPFNLGIYVIEVGMVAAILYGMIVLVALFKPMI